MANENKKNAASRAKTSEKPETQTEETKGSVTVEGAGTPAPSVAEALKTEEVNGAGPKSEQLVVSKADLEAFMRRLDGLEADNRRLLEAADKSRMAAISERERMNKTGRPTVKLTRLDSINGKLIVAWRMTKNESYIQGKTVVEHQEMEVFFQDGTSERMPLLDFYRRQNKDTVCEIVSRTKSEGGEHETLKLELKDGTFVEIELKFVN